MDEQITAQGHEHVTAAHESTLEVTSDDYLTPAGDCIVGIEADVVPATFDPDFRAACRNADATITATIEVGDHREVVTGRGHPDFTFENERSLVIRTSTYVDDRTVIVEADKAATDLDRNLVAALADGTALSMTLSVDPPNE
jgi:hypothetical protein